MMTRIQLHSAKSSIIGSLNSSAVLDNSCGANFSVNDRGDLTFSPEAHQPENQNNPGWVAWSSGAFRGSG